MAKWSLSNPFGRALPGPVDGAAAPGVKQPSSTPARRTTLDGLPGRGEMKFGPGTLSVVVEKHDAPPSALRQALMNRGRVTTYASAAASRLKSKLSMRPGANRPSPQLDDASAIEPQPGFAPVAAAEGMASPFDNPPTYDEAMSGLDGSPFASDESTPLRSPPAYDSLSPLGRKLQSFDAQPAPRNAQPAAVAMPPVSDKVHVSDLAMRFNVNYSSPFA